MTTKTKTKASSRVTPTSTRATTHVSKVREIAEFMWEQSPGHFDGALSKILVSQSGGSAFLDFRISSYLPGAHVAMHLHESKEQIYYFLEGTGLLTLGDEKTVVHPHQFAFIAPHLPHALSNTGVGQLVFLVITTPSERV
jgi:mannose-6-phosphate isomerase-like protein (cupin superfamily)